MIDIPFAEGDVNRWLVFLLNAGLVTFAIWFLLRLVRAIECLGQGPEPDDWNEGRGFRRLVLVVAGAGAVVYVLRGLFGGLGFFRGLGSAILFATFTYAVSWLVGWVVRGFTEEDEWEQYAFPQEPIVDEVPAGSGGGAQRVADEGPQGDTSFTAETSTSEPLSN